MKKILLLASIGILIGIPLGFSIGILSGKEVPKEIVGNKTLDYVVKNFLEPQGIRAELEGVSEHSRDLFQVNLSIIRGDQRQSVSVYVTKDGRYLILLGGGGMIADLTKELPKVTPQQQPQPTPSYPKRTKPNVKFFVMSFCPYGNQAEEVLEPVYNLLGDKVEWEPRYVIYSNYAAGYPSYCLDEENKYCSMHGIQELNQNVREICVWKYYDPTTWWKFVKLVNRNCNSRNADECWESYAEESGIDPEKIKKCEKEEAITLLEEELKLDQKYGVRGSPTIIINDERYRGGRTPEAFKSAICSAFLDPPEECAETLSEAAEAPAGGCG
jgi:glutaredoxin